MEGSVPGYVYVMANPHMPGLVKIGRTARHPAERQAALSRSTSVPAKFTTEGFVIVQDERAIEAKLHAVFADARTQRGEFFQISVASALEALSLFGKVHAVKLAPADPPAKMPMSWIWALSSLAAVMISTAIADSFRYCEPWSMVASSFSAAVLGLANAAAVFRFELLPHAAVDSAPSGLFFRRPITRLLSRIRQQFFD